MFTFQVKNYCFSALLHSVGLDIYLSRVEHCMTFWHWSAVLPQYLCCSWRTFQPATTQHVLLSAVKNKCAVFFYITNTAHSPNAGLMLDQH